MYVLASFEECPWSIRIGESWQTRAWVIDRTLWPNLRRREQCSPQTLCIVIKAYDFFRPRIDFGARGLA